ncbi:gag-pol [Trichonephila clavipes]|nr:gag-pol [Trichonephila clavipes]
MAYLVIGKQFIPDIDASHESIGTVLSQEIDDPIVRQITTPSTSALDSRSDDSVRKDQPADPEIKPIIGFKESSDEKPSWQDIACFHPTTKSY